MNGHDQSKQEGKKAKNQHPTPIFHFISIGDRESNFKKSGKQKGQAKEDRQSQIRRNWRRKGVYSCYNKNNTYNERHVPILNGVC